MMARATWKPHEKHGDLTGRSDLPDSVFAFPKERKEPLTDASHVRNAIARFDQTEGVSDADRDLAFANIKKAAAHYGVAMTEKSAADFTKTPKTGLTTGGRKKAAKRGAATRKKRASISTAKKTPSKKSTAKKSTARKSTAKKSTAKKTTAKKTTAKKTTRKKVARKRA
jgi:hypothetical protein